MQTQAHWSTHITAQAGSLGTKHDGVVRTVRKSEGQPHLQPTPFSMPNVEAGGLGTWLSGKNSCCTSYRDL